MFFFRAIQELLARVRCSCPPRPLERMGASTSSLPSTREELLATLEPADERLLLRNFQLLAAHDPALPGTFGAAEWFAFHAAMPPRLRAVSLAGLRGDDGSINLDTV